MSEIRTNESIFNKTKEFKSPYYVQLFYDLGDGFAENLSFVREIYSYEKKFEFELKDIVPLKGLRFDPINIKCLFDISAIHLVLSTGEEIPLEFEGNFFYRNKSLLGFETDDPNIIIKVPKLDQTFKSIKILCEFLGVGTNAVTLFKKRNEVVEEFKNKFRDSETNSIEYQGSFIFESIRQDYEEFITRYKERNEIVKNKAIQLAEENDSYSSKLFGVENKLNEINISYTALLGFKNELDQRFIEKEQFSIELQKKLTELNVNNSKLKTTIENKEKEMSSMLERNEEVITEIKDLKQKLKSSEDAIKDLETLKSIFERENKRLESIVSTNEGRLSSFIEQIKHLQSQIEEKNQHIINIEGFLHEKDSYLKILESKKEFSDAQITSLSKDVNIQSHHLENTSDMLNDLQKSLSYKLGFGLTAPARWVYNLTANKKKHSSLVNELKPHEAVTNLQDSTGTNIDLADDILHEVNTIDQVENLESNITDLKLWTLEDQILEDTTIVKHPTKKYSVLFIAPHLPDYDTSSGGKRATRMLELMANDFDVYVYTLGDRPEKYMKKLEEVGAKVLKSPLYEDIDIHTHDYQEVKDQVSNLDSIIFAWYTTYFQSSKIIELYPKANIIFDSVDVHWIREERLLKIDNSFSAEGVAINKRNEIKAYDRGNIIWAVTAEDGEHILDEIPNADVRIVSNIHEVEVTEYKDSGTNKILFLGGYKHTPNISAVKVLVEEIFPIIKKEIPDAQLLLAGSHAPDEIKAYGEIDGIDFRGFIDEEDLSALYEESFITVIPLLAGAGIKGKICEAISHMLPIATNEIGNEGINLENEVDGLIANDHKELAQLVISAMKREYNFAEFGKKAQTKLDAIVGPQAAKKEMLESISPPISICIVTWNRLELVERCIDSVLKNTTYPNYKVLVYSNGCSDGTQEYLTNLAKENNLIHPILSDKNEVFVIPNNKMMLRSEDDVVLLNNDTYVTKGWLSNLQKTAYSRKDIGISGSKILYPNGSLQEFGSELYQNYSGNNIGKNDNPGKDEYQGEKEVGYVSGCSMYITRKTIDRIGVFDLRFHPCYCEDSDMAYTAWEHGIASIVNSKSIIYHDEGGTSGTDTTNGFKAFQDLNFHKFYVKHKGKINRINWGLDALNLESFENAITNKYYDEKGRLLINGTQLENTYSVKFQNNEIRSFREYIRYTYKMSPVYNKRFILEKRLSELYNTTFNLKAFNSILGKFDEMTIGEERSIETRGHTLPNYRDSLYSQKSRTTSRLRALFQTINLYKEESEINDVYFSDNISGLYDYYLLKEKNLHYSFDDSFFGVTHKNNKILSRGLSNIKLENKSVDLAIHNELLHFTNDYKTALKEIYRILKSDGVAILSIPFLLNNKNISFRAKIDEEGDIEHLMNPVYYNNNLLCYQLFGWDFFNDCKEIGFKDAIASFSWSLFHGILGNDILTIVLKK